MSNINILKTLKPHLFLLNQVFEIEQKLTKIEEQNSIGRICCLLSKNKRGELKK